jgi:hypothetical protein
MKRQGVLTLLALASLLAACARVADAPATPTPEIFMPVPEEARADVAARETLAQHLSVDMALVATRKIVKTVWADSCLELAVPGQVCRIGDVPGYRIVLEVGDATYEVRTDASAQTVLVAGRVDSTLGELPAVCQGIGQATYYPPENDFCLAYPASFTPGHTNPTLAEIVGHPLTDDPEALRASLLVQIQTITTFMFMPSLRVFPEAVEEVENPYMTVTSSFTFLPEAED